MPDLFWPHSNFALGSDAEGVSDCPHFIFLVPGFSAFSWAAPELTSWLPGDVSAGFGAAGLTLAGVLGVEEGLVVSTFLGVDPSSGLAAGVLLSIIGAEGSGP